MSAATVLINTFKVEPANQSALLELLKDSTETVIRTLDGWRSTRLLAGQDGHSVIIYSEWDSPAAVTAMQSDPRMVAYFPKVLALAQIDSVVTQPTHSATR